MFISSQTQTFLISWAFISYLQFLYRSTTLYVEEHDTLFKIRHGVLRIIHPRCGPILCQRLIFVFFYLFQTIIYNIIIIFQKFNYIYKITTQYLLTNFFRYQRKDNIPFSTPSPTFSLSRIFRILGLDKSLSAKAFTSKFIVLHLGANFLFTSSKRSSCIRS